MKVVKNGTTRIVILVPRLGLAFKIAKVLPWAVLRSILRALFWEIGHKNYFKLLELEAKSLFIKKASEDHMPFVFMWLFQGLWDNMREFIFYLTHRSSKFPVPTYFSLLGIVNVQPLQTKVCDPKAPVWKHLSRIAPSKEFWKNSIHTFSVNNNFSTDDGGKLRVMDYASPGVQRMTKKYGSKFHSVLVENDG